MKICPEYILEWIKWLNVPIIEVNLTKQIAPFTLYVGVKQIYLLNFFEVVTKPWSGLLKIGSAMSANTFPSHNQSLTRESLTKTRTLMSTPWEAHTTLIMINNIDLEYHNKNNSSRDQNQTIPLFNCCAWCNIATNVLLKFHIGM